MALPRLSGCKPLENSESRGPRVWARESGALRTVDQEPRLLHDQTSGATVSGWLIPNPPICSVAAQSKSFDREERREEPGADLTTCGSQGGVWYPDLVKQELKLPVCVLVKF
jgi:hypothetical protein